MIFLMEQANSKTLTILESNEFILAAKQPKYVKIDAPKRQAILSAYIAEVYKFRGQVANPADLVDMAKDLDRRLSGDEQLSLLTIEEIRVAFLHGVTGEYGEYYGVNYVTLSKWVVAYFFSNERIEAIQRYRRERQRAPQTSNLLAQKTVYASEREKETQLINTLKGYFEDVRQGGEIVGMQHTQAELYQLLVKKGVIKPTREEKLAAMSRAEERLKKSKNDKPRSIIEALDDGYDKAHSGELSERDKIVRKAKSIILSDWLKSINSLPEIKAMNN